MATSPAKRAYDANPARVAPFVVNQVDLHTHSPQIIMGRSFNFSTNQAVNLDRHLADLIIPTQTSVPLSFWSSSSNVFSYKIQPANYSVKHSFLEFDITNNGASAGQLVPGPFLIDTIRFKTGSGALIQEIRGEDLWHDLAASYDNTCLGGLSNIYNISASTFGLAGTIAAGASVTYSIPLISSFLDQLNFWLGGLNNTGLTLEVYLRRSGAIITGFATDFALTAACLRFTDEYYSGKASDAKTADEQKMVHHWKFLTTGNQRQSIAMTLGNVYPMQLQSLNGLVPYAWFGLWNSLTGTGLYTFQGVTDFELLDQQNQSLQNGVRTKDAIARYEVGLENFDSSLLQATVLLSFNQSQYPRPYSGLRPGDRLTLRKCCQECP